MNNRDAFTFFMLADNKEIERLGWRIGEKLDLMFAEDFLEDIIKPFVKGIINGSYHKFENPIKIDIEEK